MENSTEPHFRSNAPSIKLPNWRMLIHPFHFLSLGLGSGLSPIAPGTVGTLFAWLSFITLDSYLPTIQWAWIIGIGFIIGVIACKHTGKILGEADHSAIVWDEILAFWVVLLFLAPSSWHTYLWAFFWFRCFDIFKPGPIQFIDEKLSGPGWYGAFGVMLDDLLAAFFTLLLFAFWRVI